MNYKLIYHPNQDCLSISISVKLTEEMIEVFDSSKHASGKHKKFAQELFKINGVSSVSLHRYTLGLTKGSVFEWENIIQKAIIVILMHYCQNEVAVEISKPEKQTIDKNGFTRSTILEEQETHTYSFP